MPVVDTQELKQFIGALRDTEKGLQGNEVGQIIGKVAGRVLQLARIPSVTGTLRASYSVLPPARMTATIHSGLNYAAVQEFGGWVRWESRSHGWTRVPINGNIRMLYANRIRVKTPVGATAQESYYIYPALRNNEEEVERVAHTAMLELIEDYVGGGA